ncbi:MAG: hypothetical protein JXD18_09185, partial [Anaerolineae bacterium]|nr:hypothetical protein [Anaerolineae bacterium]
MTGYRFLTNAARFALVSMVVVGQLGALATAGVRAADVRLEDIPGDSLRDVRAPTAETYWTTELVDPGATVGAFSSLAIDSLDQLHVAYYDGDSLRYALLSSTWATTTIDTGGNVGMYASLALDGVEPHVAYYDVTNTALRHVYYETGLGWGPSEEVDNTADVGAYSALAIDRTYHYILISYYDATNQSLKLARFDSSWSSETVDAAIGSGLHTIAMATRRAPDVRIVYHDATNDRLEYAIGISDPPYWDFSEGPVNHGGEGGYFAALALDTGGDPHVSYFSADDELVYAHHDGNMWTNTVIDSVWSEASINTAIALDADNQPHIAYTDDESAGRLTYAYLDGSTWMTQTVESSGVEGYPSIAIDADGFPHITYWTDSGLKHAWLRATSDLVVTDIWSGSSNQIWYQVQNVGQGTAPAGHQVALTIDSVASGTSTVPVDLAPGERYAAVIATVACSGSNDALRVTADNGGVVVESNETNNMRYELWDCDTTAPQITTGPQATGVTTNSAVIEWVTNENSDSWVYYDPSHLDYTTYEFEDGVYVTSHAIALTGLSPATVYRYAVESNDQAGNRVSSGEFFFETLPLPSPTLTGTLSIERGSRDYPTYAITAVISDAARALDPSIVDYASFYLNDTLVGRSYSAIRAGVGRTAYSYVLSPYQLGHSRGTFLGATHAVDVVVSVANGVDLELNDDLFPPWEEKPVEVNIWTPFNNAVYYTDGSDDLPPGTTIQLAAEAMEYEWECEWVSFRGSDPYAMPPDCGEVAQKSGPVEFYIDGAWIDTLSTPVAGTFVYVVQWDAGGLEVGPHTLTVITRDSEDIMNLASATRQFYVEEPTVGLGVERTVTRHGNYYEVELDISLSANSTNPITLDYLTDYADEFMPVQKETASYDVYFDYPAWAGSGERRAKITIDFTGGGIELEPGDSCQVSYQVVPILYEDGVADPIIGTLDVRLYYDGGDSFEVFDLSWQSLSSVQAALGTSDYIIVTNPDRLHDLYVESEVHDLLGTMAHLAVARNGVLGFLEGYVGVYADPDNDVLRDLTDGGYWADALHPNFQDSLEGYMLIVGETEIVPAFDSHNYDICWGIPDDSTHCEVRDNDVYHHDQWYSNTAGNGKPELIVGRIIGDSAWQLERPLIVSIGIAEGNFGHYYVADRALLASGGGDGVSYFEDNVDTIDMILDNVSDPSDDRWIVEVLNLAGESYPNLLVNSGIAEQISLMHLMGHGNVDSWAGALSTNDPPDLYGYMPFVFAPSCLTGNYEAGDDYNLAESLFDQGISGYVGSTQISPIQT